MSNDNASLPKNPQDVVSLLKEHLIEEMRKDPNIEVGKPHNIGQSIRRFFKEFGLDECPFYDQERYEKSLKGIQQSQYVEYWNQVGRSLARALWFDGQGQRLGGLDYLDLQEQAFVSSLPDKDRAVLDLLIDASDFPVPDDLKAGFIQGMNANPQAFESVVLQYQGNQSWMLTDLDTPVLETLSFISRDVNPAERQQCFLQAGKRYAEYCHWHGRNQDIEQVIQEFAQSLPGKTGPTESALQLGDPVRISLADGHAQSKIKFICEILTDDDEQVRYRVTPTDTPWVSYPEGDLNPTPLTVDQARTVTLAVTLNSQLPEVTEARLPGVYHVRVERLNDQQPLEQAASEAMRALPQHIAHDLLAQCKVTVSTLAGHPLRTEKSPEPLKVVFNGYMLPLPGDNPDWVMRKSNWNEPMESSVNLNRNTQFQI